MHFTDMNRYKQKLNFCSDRHKKHNQLYSPVFIVVAGFLISIKKFKLIRNHGKKDAPLNFWSCLIIISFRLFLLCESNPGDCCLSNNQQCEQEMLVAKAAYQQVHPELLFTGFHQICCAVLMIWYWRHSHKLNLLPNKIK